MPSSLEHPTCSRCDNKTWYSTWEKILFTEIKKGVRLSQLKVGRVWNRRDIGSMLYGRRWCQSHPPQASIRVLDLNVMHEYSFFLFSAQSFKAMTWPRGYETWLHSRTQNKPQWLAAWGHVSTSSQSLHFILSLRLYSHFITSGPEFWSESFSTTIQRRLCGDCIDL